MKPSSFKYHIASTKLRAKAPDIAAGGALIASAIRDALGIRNIVNELPVTPQRLQRLLRERGAS